MSGPRILCIGAAALDRTYRALSALQPDTSNPVSSERAPGGVARNVAENLARLGVPTGFITVVGDDDTGRLLLDGLRALGVETGGVKLTAEHPTAEYAAVLQPDGALAFGLADMAIFESIGPDILDGVDLDRADWVFADCNLPAPLLDHLAARARSGPFRLAVDAVSAAKARRLPGSLSGVGLLFLNKAEGRACLGASLTPEAAAVRLRERGAAAVVLTLGAEGLLVADHAGLDRVPAHPCSVVDVTGAGDALIAATLHRLLAGDSLVAAARAGTAAAGLTLESRGSVRADLSPGLLRRAMERAPATPPR